MEMSPQEHRKLQRALQGDLEIPRPLADRLEQHLAQCRDCQRLLKTSGQLREKVKQHFQASEHLSQEQLLIHLTAAASRVELPAVDRKMLRRQRAHLEKCSLCRRREQYLRAELARCEEIVFENVEEFAVPALPETALATTSAPPQKSTSVLTKTVATLSSLAAVCLLIFAVNVVFQPPDYEHTNPHIDKYSTILKRYHGGVSDPAAVETALAKLKLEEAENALYDGYEQQALHVLAGINERDLEREDLLRFQLYGLMATLKDAHSDFLGLFPGFDTTRVAAALQKMEAALTSLRPGAEPLDYSNLGPAYFYAAKACLILGRRQLALAHLKNCTALPQHRRKEQAEMMQQKLARL